MGKPSFRSKRTDHSERAFGSVPDLQIGVPESRPKVGGTKAAQQRREQEQVADEVGALVNVPANLLCQRARCRSNQMRMPEGHQGRGVRNPFDAGGIDNRLRAADELQKLNVHAKPAVAR